MSSKEKPLVLIPLDEEVIRFFDGPCFVEADTDGLEIMELSGLTFDGRQVFGLKPRTEDEEAEEVEDKPELKVARIFVNGTEIPNAQVEAFVSGDQSFDSILDAVFGPAHAYSPVKEDEWTKITASFPEEIPGFFRGLRIPFSQMLRFKVEKTDIEFSMPAGKFWSLCGIHQKVLATHFTAI